MAGDLLEFRVSAIDPRGPETELLYVVGQSVDNSITAEMWTQPDSTVVHHAPEGRNVVILIGVKRATIRGVSQFIFPLSYVRRWMRLSKQ